MKIIAIVSESDLERVDHLLQEVAKHIEIDVTINSEDSLRAADFIILAISQRTSAPFFIQQLSVIRRWGIPFLILELDSQASRRRELVSFQTLQAWNDSPAVILDLVKVLTRHRNINADDLATSTNADTSASRSIVDTAEDISDHDLHKPQMGGGGSGPVTRTPPPDLVSPPSMSIRPPISVPQPTLLPASSATSKDAVFFTAFYPRTIHPVTRFGFFVYAHLEGMLAQVEQDVKKFKGDLGGQLPPPKTAKKSANIQPGTPITITIECDDIEFSPQSLTKKWDGDWTRFDFDFKAAEALKGDTLIGSVSVSVYGIEVAQIKFAIEVADARAATDSANSDTQGSFSKVLQRFKRNPLAEAKFAKTDSVGMYHHVFVSYSRQDRVVAEAYRLAQLAMGNDVFMDTYSIRSGEDWRVALANAIDSADVFQLFWSEHSASSDNVKDEWEYALNYKCPDSKCASFIRPVYWVTPLSVKPPDELSHLNFRFVPMLGNSMESRPNVTF